MCDQCRIRGNVLDPPQPRIRVGEVLAAETEAVHPRVELDPCRDDCGSRPGFEQFELLDAVHHQVEVLLGGHRELLGAENALEQQDPVGEAGGPQREPLVEARHREAVGLRKGLGRRHEPVAVRVRLDHGHDTRGGCRSAHAAEVVAQRGRVDDGSNQCFHAWILRHAPRRVSRRIRIRPSRGSRNECTCRGRSGAPRRSVRCAASR